MYKRQVLHTAINRVGAALFNAVGMDVRYTAAMVSAALFTAAIMDATFYTAVRVDAASFVFGCWWMLPPFTAVGADADFIYCSQCIRCLSTAYWVGAVPFDAVGVDAASLCC